MKALLDKVPTLTIGLIPRISCLQSKAFTKNQEEHFMDSILTLNTLLVITLIVGVRSWQRKYGKLNARRIALIVSGYFSFFVISTFYPLFKFYFWITIVIDLILLIVVWTVIFPLAQWLYRKFNSST